MFYYIISLITLVTARDALTVLVLPGSHFKSVQYEPLLREIEQKFTNNSNITLIYGEINIRPTLGFPHDYDASQEIDSMLKMVEMNLYLKNLTSRDLVVVGHSFGGSVGQKWVKKNKS